jgi:hypothetical protein
MSETTDTPTEGNDGTATQANWERVGRDLLAEELEISGSKVAAAFHRTATRVGDGERPSDEEIREMIEALRGAYWIVESAAEASPDADAEELPAFQGEIVTDGS